MNMCALCVYVLRNHVDTHVVVMYRIEYMQNKNFKIFHYATFLFESKYIAVKKKQHMFAANTTVNTTDVDRNM